MIKDETKEMVTKEDVRNIVQEELKLILEERNEL